MIFNLFIHSSIHSFIFSFKMFNHSFKMFIPGSWNGGHLYLRWGSRVLRGVRGCLDMRYSRICIRWSGVLVAHKGMWGWDGKWTVAPKGPITYAWTTRQRLGFWNCGLDLVARVRVFRLWVEPWGWILGVQAEILTQVIDLSLKARI